MARPWAIALLLGLSAASVYGLFAWDRLFEPSTDPHFIFQAEAFLSGELELQRSPPHRNDWASIEELQLTDGRLVRGVYQSSGRGGQARRFRTLRGRTLLIETSMIRRSRRRTFVSFPSFPAVAMMPFVAAFGEAFSDVMFTVLVAGGNVALIFLFLELLVRRGYSLRTRRENIGLALLFGFGTAHLWCAVLGQVWFTALILGVGLHTAYLMAALDARHPWLAGLFLGLGMATRTPIAFASLFFLLQVLFPAPESGVPRSWAGRFGLLARFAVPVLLVGAGLIAMNLLRFEQVFEFGHTYLAGGAIERIQQHGLFGLRFVPRNLAAAFILLPSLQSAAPYLMFSRHGLSLLLSTPPLLWLLRPGPERPLIVPMLWATVALVAVPLLLYQNTGHIQFGYRFSLDVTPMLIALLALRRGPLSRLFWSLALVGVAVNAFGAVTFKRFESFYDDHFPEVRLG